ncbi:MAG: malto-oligosyltrehalose synthase, partial [Nitrososphaerales archaeon]
NASRMGLILDFVPNHMSTDSKNRIWQNVLENGRQSPHAEFFDIDWEKTIRGQKDKVALPILPEELGEITNAGKLRLIFQPLRMNHFALRFGDTKLPVSRAGFLYIRSLVEDKIKDKYVSLVINGKMTANIMQKTQLWSGHQREYLAAIKETVKEINQSPARMQALVRVQNYALIHWRDASNELNYRRFSNITDLIAIRIEDESVFSEAHSLLFDLLRRRIVQGLRIDHPDGLWDPAKYFSDLQRESLRETLASSKNASTNPTGLSPIYVIAEKILNNDEQLPVDWQVDGTTGYDFVNEVNGIFVKKSNARQFDEIYEEFTAENKPYDDIAFESKMLIVKRYMRPDVDRLVRLAIDRSHEIPIFSNTISYRSLNDAIETTAACFPVYRSYVRDAGPASEVDRMNLEHCLNEAKRRNDKIDSNSLDFVKALMFEEGLDVEVEHKRNFVMRFQQLCSAVQAKGLEDTAFYRYVRLASLNEVGGNPSKFGMELEEFHQKNIQRRGRFPHSLLGASTHDTKRSEDVRARINVISEFPAEWKRGLARWRNFNSDYKENTDYPSANDEYLFYQTIVGAWPMKGSNNAPDDEFVARIIEYMKKSSREAKLKTDWTDPNPEYEDALEGFVRNVLSKQNYRFLGDFAGFRTKIDILGRYNSTSQLLLKMTCPGIPDFYQGSEIWDYDLVDPDNRHQVDYAKRKQLMKKMISRINKQKLARVAQDLLDHSEDGMIKMFIIRQILNFRSKNKELFNSGEYLPLYANGPRKNNVCSFMRATRDQKIIVAASRFFSSLVCDEVELALCAERWNMTTLSIPMQFDTNAFLNLLTGESVRTKKEGGSSNVLELSKVFQTLPVAVLIPSTKDNKLSDQQEYVSRLDRGIYPHVV